MLAFEHERLEVYRAAVRFLVRADTLADALPRARTYLADQLRRAASSIAVNIAEGAGEEAAGDRARFYRMARRSAVESAAILDGCRVLALVTEAGLGDTRDELLEIVAMLTAMIVKRSG